MFRMEPVIDEFFKTVTIGHGTTICRLQEKYFNISQRIFSEVFDLPSTRLTSCANLPEGNADIWRTKFSLSGKTLSYPTCSNKYLKVEFRLLTDLVTKPILSKEEAFDKVTT